MITETHMHLPMNIYIYMILQGETHSVCSPYIRVPFYRGVPYIGLPLYMGVPHVGSSLYVYMYIHMYIWEYTCVGLPYIGMPLYIVCGVYRRSSILAVLYI